MENNFSNIKTPGFTAPQGYFDELENHILAQTALEEKQLKENQFSVPKDYFEQAEIQILNKTVKKQPKVISILQRKTLKHVASVAALIVLIITVYQIQNNTLSQSEIVFNENTNDFFDMYELEEMMSVDMLNDFTIENNLSDEAIYDYLSYHADITNLVYENYEN